MKATAAARAMAGNTEHTEREEFTCPDCRLGTARPTAVFFCTWVDGVFLTVPNFPAWICSVCGFREYDGAALHDLETVVRSRDRSRRLRPRQPGATGSADMPHRS